ncbi:MAG: hypothetical protein WC693_02930 [Patescibacteria group bacterium]|jgi:hypothetical protein
MNKMEQVLNEKRNQANTLGLTKERRIETVSNNIDLILRRCRRKGIQPRDMLLKAFDKGQAANGQLTGFIEELINAIYALPDYDLTESEGYDQAFVDVQQIYAKVIDFEYSGAPEYNDQQEHEQETRQHWQDAGFFNYELGEQHELILHVPPTVEAPNLSQIRSSIQNLIGVVKNDSDIQEVRGSSLLLEHPLFGRLGFKIDTENDNDFYPNFRMSREDFLNRFQ